MTPKPNILDRLISYVSPVRGARRMQARYAMQAAAHMAAGLVSGTRRLSSAQEGTLANWNPRRESRYAENNDLDTTMARAESLATNDGHAASAINALALNVTGAGMRPQCYPDTDRLGISDDEANAFADSAEIAWDMWCNEAHAGGTLHFNDLQYQAMRSLFVTGEFLHLPVWDENPHRSFGLALQPLHPARLRTPSDLQTRANIRMGVHLDASNRPLGYFIANPPADAQLAGLGSRHFAYVPRMTGHRQSCFHVFHSQMPEAVRGTSILSPAMKQFRDLADYVDYELVGALIAASFTVFIETPGEAFGGTSLNGDARSATGGQSYQAQIQPGTVTTGAAGHKPVVLSSARPGPTFDQFYERILRAAAASTGQPYEMVAKDFSKTNYSSARAALLEVWKLHNLYQEFFVRQYLQKLWAMVIEEAWIRGMLAVPAGAPSIYESPAAAHAWLSCVWTRPPRGQIDPVKERQADQLGIASLTETRAAICHGRGTDFEDVVRQQAREKHLMEKYGLAPDAAPESAQAPAQNNTEETE